MPERLTSRELDCVRLAGEGLQDKEICRRLRIPSHRTVQTHLTRAYRKLGVTDRYAAAERVRRDYAEARIPISELPPPGPPVPVTGDPGPPPTSYRPPPAGILPTTAVILGFALVGALTLCGVIVFRAMLSW